MKAFIFDLNGTMIDDMSYHARAWQQLLNVDLGGKFTYEEVKKNMFGKNQEVLVRMFGSNRFTNEEMESLSFEKEKRYQKEYLPELRLLPGLDSFLENAKRLAIPMAIASAAIPFNIDFVLDNLKIRHFFDAIVSANDVIISKPHPETFLKAAELLHTNPVDCLVFEDVPKGAEAAFNAGMNTIILTTTHEKNEFFHLPNVKHFCKDFNDEFITNLIPTN